MRFAYSPLLFLVLAVSSLACGAPPAATTPPASAPAPTFASVPPGRPLLVVTQTAILLDGTLVGDPRPIESTHRMQRIDGLTAQLHASRAADAPNSQQLWFDGLDAGVGSAVSALMTATFAKYLNLYVRTRSGWVDGRWDSPMPSASENEPAPHRMLLLRLEGNRASVAWRSDAPCDAVAQNTDVALGDLEAYLASNCGNASPCVDIARLSLESTLPFSSAADALAIARAHSNGTFAFSLLPFNGPKSTPLERTCGEPIARASMDHIPPETIQTIIRANFAPIHACYQAGLGRKADLAGKVVIRIVIDREGHVSNTEIVDSTEPPPSEPQRALLSPNAITTMPDRGVSECVRGVFAGLSFPKRTGRKTTVIYPIVFTPESK